ncbi:PREDICTED: isoamyl acetate-hydrolyzing esterase 1 homolog [Branchiostoma belcheri]|uniref:Isoamyl acetate-hydrolyzing esterase 1 homolog n=1 Tax=Branchiostoma belcheri TaxID=7741 RepID=A0A6P4ZPD5_BRABE|nr:PREDICTED: isoamyl acetate-hydrolyzing esterase 1 homolog [Branchiostoma belcheri]
MAASCDQRKTGLKIWPKVILFGDSITQYAFNDGGWGAALQELLQRKCDIICRGFSGYNTTWANMIQPQVINQENASDVVLVIIFFGANDSSLKEENPQQHVPLESYKKNLRDMVHYLQGQGIGPEKIILITPPPLDEAEWRKVCKEKGLKLNRLNAVTGQYAKMCCEVAVEKQTSCVDLYTYMQNEKDWRKFLSDGLHLSREGSQFLARCLSPIAQDKTDHLPFIFPHWDSIDTSNPEKSLLYRHN